MLCSGSPRLLIWLTVQSTLSAASVSSASSAAYYNTIEMVLGSQVNGQLKHISEDERNEAVAMISESAAAEETEETEAADKVD